MASTYSPNLRLELITTGEQSGTWGTTTNINLGTLLEQAIGGSISVAITTGDNTLTSFNATSDQARNAVIILTGSLAGTTTVNCGLIEKVYIVKNSATGAVTFRANSSDSGIEIAAGATQLVYCDGTNVYTGLNALPSGSTVGGETIVTLTGTQTLTNKTLTSPTISGGTLSGTLTGGTIASATLTSATITSGTITGITDLTVADGGTGASTAADARTNLSAAKSGANTDITSIGDTYGNIITEFNTAAGSAVTENYVAVTNSDASGTPKIEVKGGDTNISFNLVTKGSGTLQYNGQEIQTKITTENAQSGTSYTLVLSDNGKLVTMTNSSANTLTVPPNSSVAFPIGARIDIAQYGTGETSVVAGSGVTIRSADSNLSLSSQYSAASLWKRNTNEWLLVGALA